MTAGYCYYAATETRRNYLIGASSLEEGKQNIQVCNFQDATVFLVIPFVRQRREIYKNYLWMGDGLKILDGIC